MRLPQSQDRNYIVNKNISFSYPGLTPTQPDGLLANFRSSSVRAFAQKKGKKAEKQNDKESAQKEEPVEEKHEEKTEQEPSQEQEDEQDRAQFKMYRKVLFFAGTTLKYLSWAVMASFFYHYAIVRKYENPEKEAPFFIGKFLEAGFFADYFVKDMTKLFTKPGMTKMLPDRILPPHMCPKTLVINLNGTLVHQEYKMGVGMEVFKRPGLSSFLSRLSR